MSIRSGPGKLKLSRLQALPGGPDGVNGAIVFAEEASASNYGLVDEIAARVIAAGGRVIGVRKADIPHAESLAAILRYPV